MKKIKIKIQKKLTEMSNFEFQHLRLNANKKIFHKLSQIKLNPNLSSPLIPLLFQPW
jgi:hypothetical protein